MKKKTTALQVSTFRGLSHIFYSLKKDKADKEYLRDVFTDEEIKQIEKYFNQFYKLVYDNCIDKQSQTLFKKFKEEFMSTYFSYMHEIVAFSPFRRAINAADKTITTDLLNDNVFKSKIILSANQTLFFFADILIAFVMGNDKKLKEIKKRFNDMTGRKIPPTKMNILNKIKKTQRELERKHGRSQAASMNKAIKETYKKLTDNEKHVLLNKVKKENNSIAVPISLTNEQIHSINSQISYHKNKLQK